MTESKGLHEEQRLINADTQDRHRAIVSLQEEMEAVDWYDQRIDATDNEELKAILAHNRDEEKEHAAMLMEWLRKNDAKLDEELREYLFSSRSFKDLESHEKHKEEASESTTRSLNIGSLREEV